MGETPSLFFNELTVPSLPRKIETRLTKKGNGKHFVIGVDEAGRGPLAGPVVAAAFTFAKPGMKTPAELSYGITDSKQVSEDARDHLFRNMLCHNDNARYKVSVVDNKTIDRINILQATFLAMSDACLALIAEIRTVCPDASFSVLIDGNKVPPQLSETDHECQFVIKGDSLEFVIAAASICAKVTRDNIMRQVDDEFPQYGFRQHKGYPTGSHVAAISKHGPCKYHRMTFAPLKNMKKTKRKTETSVATSSAVVDAREERLKRRNEGKGII